MQCKYLITHKDDGILASNLNDELLVEWLDENGLDWLFDTSEKDASFERSDLWAFNKKLENTGLEIWANN